MLSLDPEAALYAVPFERAVLGAMLIDARCIGEISVTVPADAFTEPMNKRIYLAICELNQRGEGADQLTVSAEIYKQWGGDSIAIEDEVSALITEATGSANTPDHCRVLIEKWQRRKINRLGHELLLATLEQDSVEDMLGKMNRCAETINDLTDRRHTATMADAAGEGYAKVVERSEKSDRLTGIHTGYDILNRYTGGWQPDMYIIVAAPTGRGKTTLAMMHALRAAKSGHPVSVFSMEMSTAQLGERCLSAESRVDTLLTGIDSKFTPAEWERIHAANEHLAGLKIFIDTTAALTVHELSEPI